MSKGREWWRRVKDFADKNGISFTEAKNLGAGRRDFIEPLQIRRELLKTDITNMLKYKYVCKSCGREAKSKIQRKCKICGASIIKKLVIVK